MDRKELEALCRDLGVVLPVKEMKKKIVVRTRHTILPIGVCPWCRRTKQVLFSVITPEKVRVCRSCITYVVAGKKAEVV